MSSLKNLIKKALDKKQGVKNNDGHDAVGHAQQTIGSNTKSVKGGSKPTTRTTGRGR